MGRHVNLDQLHRPADAERFVLQHGGSSRQCDGSHFRLYGPDGQLLATLTDNGELGPHSRSALKKALAVLLVLVPLACGIMGIAAYFH